MSRGKSYFIGIVAILVVALVSGMAFCVGDDLESGKGAYEEWRVCVENKGIIERIEETTGKDFNFYLYELVSSNLGAEESAENLKTYLDKEFLGRSDLTANNKTFILYLKAKTDFARKKYALAKRQYLRLKLQIGNKNDPLYKDADNKLREIDGILYYERRKDKIEDMIYGEGAKFLYPIIAIIAILFWAFAELDKKVLDILGDRLRGKYPKFRDGRKKKTRIYRKIVPGRELIKLREMADQDGRASWKAVEKYVGGQSRGDEARYAKLIVEGYRMIRRINRCMPYPLLFLSKFPLFRRIWINYPPCWCITAASFVFVIMWVACSYNSGQMFNNTEIIQGIVDFFLMAALLIATLTGLHNMSQKTVNSLDELVSIMEPEKGGNPPKSMARLEREFIRLFRSPWQFYIGIVLFALVVFYYGVGGMGNSVQPGVVDFCFIFALIMIVSPVIWFLCGSLCIVKKICALKNLADNPLSPLKTMGLQKWISVIGTYAITVSIIITFGASMPIIESFIIGGQEPPSCFWLILFLPFLILYWIYPYWRLGILVRTIKTRRMQFLKTRMVQMFNLWEMSEDRFLEDVAESKEFAKSPEEVETLIKKRSERFQEIQPILDQLDKFHEIFKNIDASPDTYFDAYSALQLLQAIVIPVLLALLPLLCS